MSKKHFISVVYSFFLFFQKHPVQITPTIAKILSSLLNDQACLEFVQIFIDYTPEFSAPSAPNANINETHLIHENFVSNNLEIVTQFIFVCFCLDDICVF